MGQDKKLKHKKMVNQRETILHNIETKQENLTKKMPNIQNKKKENTEENRIAKIVIRRAKSLEEMRKIIMHQNT